VVAVNGGAIRAEGPTVNLYPRDRQEARETMNALMGPATAPMPGFVLDDVVRRAHTGPLARIAAGAATMGNYLLEGHLDRVTVPVELVWGDADQLMTMDYARRMLDGLPDARLHVVHGCGHVPHRECPLRFLEVLRPALEGRSPKGDAPAEPVPAADGTEEAAT
jgi:pimeloyl-ACP methyl ester carboxylesterase